jgi:predicted kinase
MAAPVLAGIPLVYEMLVGAGILAGGAVTANKMQKEIQKTIDTNPGVIDEALKNIFMGPARELINPKMLEEIQNVKPTTTAKKKTMPTTEISPDDVMANTLFQEPTNNLFGMIDTPSGTVLAPDAADIETQRKEAAPKPLVTPMPTGQQDQTLSTPVPQQQDQTLTTPVPEKTDMLPGMDQAPMPDMNILNKEDTSYRIQHQPKGPETEDSVRLDDLTKSITGEKAGYPDDFYSDKGQRLYAPGPRFKDDEYGMANQESFQIINKVKNKPDEEVTIYRAVPNDDKIKDINIGDFVTLSKKYAELHGAGGYGRDGNDAGKILEKKVKVKDIYWDQNDVNEFGYFPKFEFPSEEVRNQEINLSKNLFELSQNNPTLDMYEQYKNNPIIQNKIESSKKAYVNTSAKEGYGTADYWANRKFVDDTVGYKDFIKKVYGDGAPKKNKEMYIVMGPSSAGKSSSLVDKLVPETGSYLADSDEIKKLLPEFTDGYNAGGVHKESSDINQRIMKIALARGDNIVYPTTGREPAKLAKEIERAEKYGYTPKVYLVTADREVLLLRNLGRMLSTNRVVDSDLLLNEQLIKDINKTYENLPEKYKAGKYDTSKDKR